MNMHKNIRLTPHHRQVIYRALKTASRLTVRNISKRSCAALLVSITP